MGPKAIIASIWRNESDDEIHGYDQMGRAKAGIRIDRFGVDGGSAVSTPVVRFFPLLCPACEAD
jgi:hypothetical protein